MYVSECFFVCLFCFVLSHLKNALLFKCGGSLSLANFVLFPLALNTFFLQLSGFKKVLNYTKKVMEEIRYRTSVSREEVIFA